MYIKEVLKKFDMEECSLVSMPKVTGCKISKMDESPTMNQTLYRSIIGMLLYLTASRPDVMQVVAIVRIFQANPRQSHLLVAKRILRYLKTIMDYGLWYLRGKEVVVLCFSENV